MSGTNVVAISGNLVNGGTIDLSGPAGSNAVGDQLTIGGNFTGLAGGAIRLDAVLGADGTSDQIIIEGNLDGTTSVFVNSLGGVGGLTSGDGIRVATVGGVSQANALTLAGDPIDLGAFTYGLFNGSLANPADQDWYLRSRLRDIVVPTMTIARLAEDLSLTALGTLNERIGEPGGNPGESGFLKGMWGRAFGKDSDTQTAQSASFGDTRSEGRVGGLQMGVDLYRTVAANGTHTSIGLFGGHLWSSTTDISLGGAALSAGSTLSDGWMLGGYITHVGASGWYVDAVLQRDWLDHRTAGADGTRALTQSNATLASLEVGTSLGRRWMIEPQAQLIYASTSIDDFADSRGTTNRIATKDSLIGRGGLRLKRTWDVDENSDSGAFTLYAKANLWSRLRGGTSTLFIGQSLPGLVQFRETWGDAGVGGTYAIGRSAEIFADVEVEYGLDQSGTALAGRGGVRLRF